MKKTMDEAINATQERLNGNLTECLNTIIERAFMNGVIWERYHNNEPETATERETE